MPGYPLALIAISTLLYIHIRHYEATVAFAWDERKNRSNSLKHGVSFETAVLVFDDPFHVSLQEREVAGEPRWQTIGMIKAVHVLVVVHMVDEEEDVIRIISARKATPREREIYAQGN